MAMKLIYKDGSEAENGDVIRWKTWDSDDFTTWTFTGLYKNERVVYLSGGADLGLGIGNIKEVATVIEESQDNDYSGDNGVIKIGRAVDISRHIKSFKGA